MRALVIAAHPDDEVLGCGGTIARWASEGNEVHTLILGEGATSRAATREAADGDQVALLAACADDAGRILGSASVEVLGLPDNRFDSIHLLQIVKSVESAIDQHGPDTVLTQHGGDVNVDHQRTFRAVLAATRPQPGHPVRTVMSFDVASSTEWAFSTIAPRFQPSVFVDITSHLDAKLAAMEAYGTEVRPFPHARSLDSLRAQAVRAGTTVGVAAAEAFHLVRDVR